MNNDKEILINEILELCDDVPRPEKFRNYLNTLSIDRLARRLLQLKKEQIRQKTTYDEINDKI